jgi:beta-galactosidase
MKILALALAAVMGSSVLAEGPAFTAKFMTNWKDPLVIKTTGRLVMPHPGEYNGKTFVGWRSRKDNTLHAKFEEVAIASDVEFKPEYEATDFSALTAGSDGKPTLHETGKGIFYALGDSITFGTKAGGNGGVWAKFVAEKLGLKYANDARAGSRLSAWRSVLTQSNNHNQAVESQVGGIGRDQMLEGIRSAGVIGFTLGTNDLLFQNKGEDVAKRMLEFVEALHHYNPQALVVLVGGGSSEAFRPGGQHAAAGPAGVALNEILGKVLNGPKYRDYCLYVDITDIFADHSTYEPCERAPDGIHPGFEGQKKIAEKVLRYVKACAGAASAPQLQPIAETAAPPEPPMCALPGREAMWSFADAGHDVTACRERFSMNGLWAFRPEAAPKSLDVAPAVKDMEYFFKVPGAWPENNGWAQNGMAVYDSRGADVFAAKIRKIESAWYGRSVEIPKSWADRKTVLGFAWVPSAVLVYVDGHKAGEVFFPGGEVDLTGKLTPGRHDVAFFTTAKIAEQMITAFDAPDTARSFAKKAIEHKGINGDVWIAAEPKLVRIDDVQCRPSVVKGRIDFSIGFADVAAGASGLVAVAEVFEGGRKAKTFTSAPFAPKAGGRFVFGGEWKDAKPWDLDTPENVYTVKVRLEQGGQAVDESYPEEFGFRDIEIDGRNLRLNGSIVHFRPCNTEYSRQSAVANEDIRTAAADRKAWGFNTWVPTSNYGFSEGDVTAFEAMVRESSRVGMATVVGLPHPNRFDDPKNPHHWQYGPAYDRLVKHMVKRLQNVPGLLYWSSTHNATGYESDQNPAIISGKPDEIPTNIVNWRQRFRELALTVNEKMGEFDPTRPVYHHESGAEGTFYTLNCYLNWAPVQERSDWFEHWEKEGVMPLIVVEWGTPHVASWSSYRGGPKGVNIWSARDWTQQCWMKEFNSAFLGERAFRGSEAKRLLMDRTQYKLRGNKPSYFGGNFTEPLENEPDTSEVLSLYAARNYRDLRARGVTSFLPWDIDGRTFYFDYPKDKEQKKVRGDLLKGIKDFGAVRSDYFYRIYDQYGQEPRAIAKTLKATYADLLGWVAGKVGDFTTVNDTYRAGEKVEKSLVILNDSRRTRSVEWVWRAGETRQRGTATIKPGERADVPVVFTASADVKSVDAAFRCEDAKWKAADSFALSVLPAARKAKVSSPVSVVDPEGTAKAALKAIGVACADAVSAPKGGILVVGRNALAKAPFDVLAAAKSGLRTVILEQDAATLKKLGFRFQEHGLRNLFPADETFAGADLTDWRGSATSLPEYLPEDKMKGDWATTDWEGFKNRRVWRAGNRGIVSAVLPQKPTKGDFLPLLHGGFNLEYAPAVEYAAPGVRVILSQLDICGRTEPSPEAEEALAKILARADRPLDRAPAAKVLVLSGSKEVEDEFRNLCIPFESAGSKDQAQAGDILVVGRGAACSDLTSAAERGVKVLAFRLGAKEANQIYPAGQAREAKWNEYPELNAALGTEPLFRGISNADIQWTYPSNISTLARYGDDVLKAFKVGTGAIVISSIAPATFDENEIALRANRRRAQGLMTRLVANLGGAVDGGFLEKTGSLYGDKPRQDDDPYRYYRW